MARRRPPASSRVALGAALALALALSCAQDRTGAPPSVVYDTDVAPILQARCVACHSGAAPAGGWSATSYLGAIACVAPTGAAATLPADARAPLLAALAKAPHVGIVGDAERATLTAWVAAGATARLPGVHAAGIVDPRSSAWHGKALRDARWAPMLDAKDPGACSRCHDGTPSPRPGSVTFAAPGATACTSCHDQPGGALACGTCHGSGPRSYPPRDPCFFPGDVATAGPHAAHAEASPAHAAGFSCATCHPAPGAGVIGGLHGNGSVEVIFDPTIVGPEASYEGATRACAVGCHDRGGARPRPSWVDGAPVGCGDCHGSPPAAHFPGACNACHREANAAGTSLTSGPLHLNGKIDLGDGSGGCGACHGKGNDPWPSTAAHPGHASPTSTLPVACASCHVVPATVLAAGHLDGVATIVLGGRARDRGANPSWNGASCADVACHGAGLSGGTVVVPTWADLSGRAKACGACHGIPPTEQHTTSTSCDRSTCHGAEVARSAAGVPSITAVGLSLHIDGLVETAR